MGLAFLTPLFLGGLALLVAPWLIHQIRKPERELTRFSSLMFIPKTRKEVIERRRVQHILLMLLRMAILAILALAFSRPYLRSTAVAQGQLQGAAWHVILLDASYSMGADGGFEKARAEALDIVDALGAEDRVGVIVFSNAPRATAPLFSDQDSSAGSKSLARQTIESAQLTEEATRYVAALQVAQSMLLSAEQRSADPSRAFVIHLVSDLGTAGFPKNKNLWKLDSRIELRCKEIEAKSQANCSIVDVSVREAGPKSLRVRGKIRNWSPALKASPTVKLFTNETESAQRTLEIEPGAARQVSFLIPLPTTADLEGRLELDSDPLEIDNRRYFVHQIEKRRRVLLLAPGDSKESRESARFLSSALPQESDIPWRLELHEEGKLSLKNNSPAIIIITNPVGLSEEDADALERYIDSGGQALVTLDSATDPVSFNAQWLAKWGTRLEGRRFPEKRESRFALLSWIDFSHPAFFNLRLPQFNDFSNVRFYNNHILSISNRSENGPRAIARFESDVGGEEPPAVIECQVGKGRVLIWAFGANLQWSNLPRSVKFIPLLHETLAYLGGGEKNLRKLTVGDPLLPPKIMKGAATVELPGSEVRREWKSAKSTSGRAGIRRAGFIRWRPALADQGEIAEPVNLLARESDMERVSPDELQLKLCAPQTNLSLSTPLDLERGSEVEGFVIQSEFWRLFLGLLFALFFLESWRAAAILS